MRFASIRSNLLVSSLLILLLSLGLSFSFSNQAFNAALRASTYTELQENALYLNGIIAHYAQPWQEGHFDDYARSTATRITLIGYDGEVLFDSSYPLSDLNNHLYRQEVQQALQKGSATMERRSSTQNLPVLYYALALQNHPTLAVLRVSKTLNQLAGYQKTYQRLFLANLAIVLLIGLIITTVSITLITKPLKKIQDLAKRYAQGELKAHLTVQSPTEMAELSSSMQQMALLLRTNMEGLQSSHNRLEAILNNLHEGILLLDTLLCVEVANREAVELLGLEIIGRRLGDVLASNQILALCNTCCTEGSTNSLTIAQYKHLYGETAALVGKRKTKTLRFRCSAITEGDQIVSGIVVSIQDITELTRLEQVRKDFVANVSHELKTPITSITGFSEALLQAQTTEEKERFTGVIHRQATVMKRIVDDLLLLSSLEQTNAHPTMAWTQVNQLFEETLHNCNYRFEEKHSTLLTTIENPLEYEILCNGMLIVQALTNLVINAVTYSAEGSTVELGCHIDQDEATFTVKDEGIGIPLQDQERIFERFYRVDTARSRSQGGTGLGLSIVKHIVGVHHGSVQVQSEEGKGSLFVMRLPRSGKEMNELEARSVSLYSKSAT